MKKKPANEDSDEFDVDEPEEFQDTGSDWDPEDEEGGGGAGGRKRKSRVRTLTKKGKSNSTSKKKKVEKATSEEEDEDEEDEEDGEEEEEEESEDDSGIAPTNGKDSCNVPIKAFTNGTFVVLKTDFQAGGNPPLWKIDGKALLQKYVPFEQDGKTLYKNTSTYSGWTQNNRDQYTAAPVTYVQQGKKDIIIEFNRDKVKIEEKKEEVKETSPPVTETVDA